jgi:hypothetical protein
LHLYPQAAFQRFVLFSETQRSPPPVIVAFNKDASKAGLGGMNDAEFWGVAWAMFAAAAGTGLVAAAIALVRSAVRIDMLEFDGGYNALAPTVDR